MDKANARSNGSVASYIKADSLKESTRTKYVAKESGER